MDREIKPDDAQYINLYEGTAVSFLYLPLKHVVLTTVRDMILD